MSDAQKYTWIDPKTIPQNDDILFVLVDDRVGMIGWFIKWWSRGQVKDHSSGNYNHAMMMRKSGMLVTQANVFKEIPVDAYMTSTTFLKFWRVKGLTYEDRRLINEAIDKKLSLPWWKRMYDFVGLLGQSTSFTHWIQIPGLWFCSESGADLGRLDKTLFWMPKQPSPSSMDEVFRAHSEDMEVLGYWFCV